ncbi:hypothetical protein B0H13DRAFT_2377107 [Mycena leptocephala]|nr:hypothetical protein B0H13DRAFT_2377107 [Mycena leptocephala]
MEIEDIPVGCIRLDLALPPKAPYLIIPRADIQANCVYEVKYLRYLIYTVLQISCTIIDADSGTPLQDNDALVSQGHYAPILDIVGVDAPYLCAIHPAIAETVRSPTPSQVHRESDFRDELVRRDGGCVFSGLKPDFAAGAHIIRFSKSHWLEDINQARAPDAENKVSHINDTRNGYLADPTYHKATEQFEMAILPTPNDVLQTSDVPPSTARTGEHVIPPGCAAPSDGRRYTCQWIGRKFRDVSRLRAGTDMMFLLQQADCFPSSYLLHYLYGVAAFMQWGRKREAITTRPHPVRVPSAQPAGPTYSPRHHPYGQVNEKRQAARPDAQPSGSGSGSSGGRKGRGKQRPPATVYRRIPDAETAADIILAYWHASPVYVDNPFLRLWGKPPIMVAGMTPCAVQGGLVCAVLPAGYHLGFQRRLCQETGSECLPIEGLALPYSGSAKGLASVARTMNKSARSHAIFSLTLPQKKFVGSGPPPRSSSPLAANGRFSSCAA